MKTEISTEADRVVLTRRECAKLIGVGMTTLDRLCREGHLRPVRWPGGGPVRYRASDVLAFIAKLDTK